MDRRQPAHPDRDADTEQDHATGDDCQPSKSVISLNETWSADDEVVFDGPERRSVPGSMDLMLLSDVSGGALVTGRYRCTHGAGMRSPARVFVTRREQKPRRWRRRRGGR